MPALWDSDEKIGNHCRWKYFQRQNTICTLGIGEGHQAHCGAPQWTYVLDLFLNILYVFHFYTTHLDPRAHSNIVKVVVQMGMGQHEIESHFHLHHPIYTFSDCWLLAERNIEVKPRQTPGSEQPERVNRETGLLTGQKSFMGER